MDLRAAAAPAKSAVASAAGANNGGTLTRRMIALNVVESITIPESRHEFGPMNVECSDCGRSSLERRARTQVVSDRGSDFGICCDHEKVQLKTLDDPPEPLRTSFGCADAQAVEFRTHITQYNSGPRLHVPRCPPATKSSTGTVPMRGVFHIQGNLYHLSGSLTAPDGIATILLAAVHALNTMFRGLPPSPIPRLPLCLVPETVAHYLLACPRFRRQRLRLIMRLGTARLSLHRLLAVEVRPQAVLSFVRDTDRFPRYGTV
ncbi:hypothetical protein B0H14DRAFT_3474574 [Mycena olivaceomarginata]|nr:hypothetical protein B0H14DRAFT_3474574 [Mycena olivaceomarginata]